MDPGVHYDDDDDDDDEDEDFVDGASYTGKATIFLSVQSSEFNKVEINFFW